MLDELYIKDILSMHIFPMHMLLHDRKLNSIKKNVNQRGAFSNHFSYANMLSVSKIGPKMTTKNRKKL